MTLVSKQLQHRWKTPFCYIPDICPAGPVPLARPEPYYKDNHHGNFCLYDLLFCSTTYVPMTPDMHPLVLLFSSTYDLSIMELCSLVIM